MVMELNLPYMMMSCDMLMKLHLCASDDIYDNRIIPLICRWNYASHMIKKITPLISFDYTSDMIMELYLSYDVMCYGDEITSRNLRGRKASPPCSSTSFAGVRGTEMEPCFIFLIL